MEAGQPLPATMEAVPFPKIASARTSDECRVIRN